MQPKVSVCCTTYNHERYLKRCLDSIVCQKTNFAFELLVFEDCSKDGTRKILEEYASKYPDIIIPLYQEENRYSKDIHVCENFVFPLVRGEYVALCEGDDYWTDEYKLQKQVDALDRNPQCNFCTHRVELVGDKEESLNDSLPRINGKLKGRKIGEWGGVLSPEETISLGYMHTTSYMMRTAMLKKYLSTQLYKGADVFDVPILNYFVQLGDSYYFDQPMSCYRCARIGNWTQNHNAHTHGESMLDLIERIDQYFERKWTVALDKYRFEEKILVCFANGSFSELKGKRWKKYINQLTNKKLRIKIKLEHAFPWLIKLVNKIKGKGKK